MDLDTEGRYLFLNAVANQLRYPNNHTHYFSFILLYLFHESNQVRNALSLSFGEIPQSQNLNICCLYGYRLMQETIQEQITRVLLERLIVNRPHPWGLLITFIELIKVKTWLKIFLGRIFGWFPKPVGTLQNPRYSFWSRSFTRCASEIEKLFESVSRSFGGPKPVDDSLVSAGIPDNLH